MLLPLSANSYPGGFYRLEPQIPSGDADAYRLFLIFKQRNQICFQRRVVPQGNGMDCGRAHGPIGIAKRILKGPQDLRTVVGAQEKRCRGAPGNARS